DRHAPGLVEFDAARMAADVLEVAKAAVAEVGGVDAVGIANQRASAGLWGRATGEPGGPGLGWEDLREVVERLALAGRGVRVAPAATATKAAQLLLQGGPDRARDLCVGAVDSWVAWTLSEGALHVTDVTNMGVTALRFPDQSDWDQRILDAMRIPTSTLPTI